MSVHKWFGSDLEMLKEHTALIQPESEDDEAEDEEKDEDEEAAA